MKPIFNIKEMILMGLMLFVLVGTFANNTNEGKNNFGRSGDNILVVAD